MKKKNAMKNGDQEKTEDLKNKTAEEASINERRPEKDFRGTGEEFKDAKKEILESVRDIRHGKNPGGDLKQSTEKIG